MRKITVKTSAVAALLLGAALACGQQPAAPPADKEKPKDEPAKTKLEEMLEKALHDNPDVRLAAAKLAEAEAELTRARLQVVQKVAAAYQAVEAQKAAVASAATELAEVKSRVGTGTTPQGPEREAERKLIDAKAKLADLESQLPYLLGQQPAAVDETILRSLALQGPQRSSEASYADYVRRYYLDLYGRLPTKDEMKAGVDAKIVVQGPAADRIRAALDKPFSFECKDQTVSYLLQRMNSEFQDANPDLLIKNNIPFSNNDSNVSVVFAKVPFGAALEWVEDSSPKYRIAVRDYGLVIAPKDDLPPGAPPLRDFWKGGKAEGAGATKPVEGLVKDVDKDGRLHISIIGKSDGLATGDFLMVIRQESEEGRALLVGRVRVVEVSDGEAVAEPTEPLHTPAKPGDKVRGPDAGGKPEAKEWAPNPPPVLVEGVVKEVAKDGLVRLSVGGDAGLAKGHTLEVFRSAPPGQKGLYVGRIRIVDVSAGEAVGQPVLRANGYVKPGDQVTSDLGRN